MRNIPYSKPTMKTLLLLPLVLALPAYAGTSSKEVIAPAPEPCLTTWFMGGSVGYLTELEEPMYNLHVGVTNSCWSFGGWNLSLFGEVGYTSHDETLPVYVNDYQTSYDLTLVPITLNFKLEHALVGNLKAYFGAGLGAAWVDFEVSNKGIGSASEDDWVFTAQVFTGLNYEVTKNFDIYGGARWIYYSNATIVGVDLDLQDDWLFELGLRFKF